MPVCPNKVLKLMLKLSHWLSWYFKQTDQIICSLYIVMSISNIFNCSIQTGIFADEWKSARVSPVFKNWSRSNFNSYIYLYLFSLWLRKSSKKEYMIRYINTFQLITCYQIADWALEHFIVLLRLHWTPLTNGVLILIKGWLTGLYLLI